MSKRHVTPTPNTGLLGHARWTPALKATAVVTLGLFSWGAQAENLVDLYQAARNYDAAYLSAKAQAESVQSQYDQSLALRRPTLNLQASVTRNRLDSSLDSTQTISAAAALGAAGGSTSNNVSSTNRKIGLSARQPLFNSSNSAKIGQAEQTLRMAQADLKLAEDDLAARLAQAYFDVLGAQDVLNSTQSNKKALSEQLASAKRNFEVGNTTITDTREAQARFDLADAQEIAATNDLRIKRIALDQLVGRKDVVPSPLRTPVKLDALTPGDMEDWDAKTSDAPLVRKAEMSLAIAKLEIDKAKAGHLPTLDAVASVQNSDMDTSNASAKASSSPGTSAAIGLELNMALYSGNSVQNRIREVLSLEEKAERDLDNAKRSVSLSTRQAFSSVQSGLAQVQAYEAAEASSKLALEATQLGYRVGVRINKDVLDAQTALSSTQKDLYKARYDVIVGSVKLRQASGTLKVEDLSELNKLLSTQ